MARRSSRLYGKSPFGEKHTWNYQGKHEHLWVNQSVCAGQEVTQDCALLHPTTNCGHTFIAIQRQRRQPPWRTRNTVTTEVLSMLRHLQVILISKRSTRKRKPNGKALGVKRKRGKLTARKTQRDAMRQQEEVVVKPKDKDEQEEVGVKPKDEDDNDNELVETQPQPDDTSLIVSASPAGFPNYERMAVSKSVWSSSHGVQSLMNRFLPDVNDKQWGIKSLFMTIIEKFDIDHT